MFRINNVSIDRDDFRLHGKTAAIIIRRLILIDGGDKIGLIPGSIDLGPATPSWPGLVSSAFQETVANRAQQPAERRRRTLWTTHLSRRVVHIIDSGNGVVAAAAPVIDRQNQLSVELERSQFRNELADVANRRQLCERQQLCD